MHEMAAFRIGKHLRVKREDFIDWRDACPSRDESAEAPGTRSSKSTAAGSAKQRASQARKQRSEFSKSASAKPQIQPITPHAFDSSNLPPVAAVANQALKRETPSGRDSLYLSAAQAMLRQLRAEVVEELQIYAGFEVGWDGYNGAPFTDQTLRTAAAVAELVYESLSHADVVPREFSPGPVPDGRVDIEVATATRQLVVTISHSARSLLITHKELDSGHEGVAQSNKLGLGQWLDWLTGATPVLESVPGERIMSSCRATNAKGFV